MPKASKPAAKSGKSAKPAKSLKVAAGKTPPAVAPRPTRLAAIDIGSNAMRMLVAELRPGFTLEIIKSLRSPVRLGHDVFSGGEISEATTKRALKALQSFADWLRKLDVTHHVAVATSATREASNRQEFMDRVQRQTGLELTLLPGEEEARLVYMAVHRRLPLEQRSTLVVDIGGGSVELILGRAGQVTALESLKMGTVRMLERLGGGSLEDFTQRVREYVEATRGWVDYWLAEQPVDLLVGTGGNCEELGRLGRSALHLERDDALTPPQLDDLVDLLASMDVETRRERLGLRSDRADVILPAALVLQSLLRQTGASQLVLPHVGLKDGVLEDLRSRVLGQVSAGSARDQVLAAALQLGRKYDFDEAHARKVKQLALQLFDQLKPLHGYGAQERLLLESASLLHDIGKFINFSGHHKHSYYLVESSPLVGLTQAQRRIVAILTRYHRKTPPSMNHEFYRELPAPQRTLVARLSALLRLAEALDAEHGGLVDALRVQHDRSKVTITLEGRGDLMLERWSAAHKTEPFDRAYGTRLVISPL